MSTSLPADSRVPFPAIRTLAIVGFGLLGGSLARAAREYGLAKRILAVPGPGQDLTAALRAKIIDDIRGLRQGVEEADMAILATPVDVIAEQLPKVLDAIPDGALVTDVGSAKARIVEVAAGHSKGRQFVGSHPMAGSHLGGWEHGTANLCEGRSAFVTVAAGCDFANVVRVAAFWEAAGALPVMVHPKRHDELVALLSHLPQIASSALMAVIGEAREDINLLTRLSGAGLRDTTRIAASDTAMWGPIVGQNSERIAPLLESLGKRLLMAAQELREGDAAGAIRLLEHAAEVRRRF